MLRARELSTIIDDARPRLIVTTPDWSGEVAQVVSDARNLSRMVFVGDNPRASDAAADSLDALAAGSTPFESAWPTAVDDIALIAYTMGADGRWKGACHSPGDVLASADTYARQVLGLRDGDVVGGHPPIAFTYGLGALAVFPLRVGCVSVLTERFDAGELLEAIGREGVTVFFGTPTGYRLLMQMPGFPSRFNLRSLRLCVSAGEPLGGEDSKAWTAATGVELLDGLGTTELFHIVISQRPGSVRHGSMGLPVPGYEIRVVDGGLHDVAGDTPGRLAVRGPTGCRYWNRIEAQKEYVQAGWNLTGDEVRRDSDGYCWFVRRHDDLIVSAGYNIGPPEVETVLRQHPAVAEAAVVAVPDPIRGAVPKAFVVLESHETPGAKLTLALQEHTASRLASYKRPRQIEFVRSLPTAADGSLDRAALRARIRRN
jgi:2-aminobenzoate-CoA ligase